MEKTLLNKTVKIKWRWEGKDYILETRIIKITENGITLTSEKKLTEVFSKIIYEGDIILCVTGRVETFLEQAKTGLVDLFYMGFVTAYSDNLSEVCSKY